MFALPGEVCTRDRIERNVRSRGLAVATAGLFFVAGCVDHDEMSLCQAYAEYVVFAEQVRDADPTGVSAGTVSGTVDVLLAELTQLRSVADGRYRAPIDALETLLDDVQNTLESLTGDADYATWEPLIDDDLDGIAIADARLRRVMDPACPRLVAIGEA